MEISFLILISSHLLLSTCTQEDDVAFSMECYVREAVSNLRKGVRMFQIRNSARLSYRKYRRDDTFDRWDFVSSQMN